MKTLIIQPLEPLVLSSTPIASPDSFIGSHRVLGAPSPTTLAGFLGSILGVNLNVNTVLDSLEALCNELRLRGASDPVVKGPLVKFVKMGGRELDGFYVSVSTKEFAPIDALVLSEGICFIKRGRLEENVLVEPRFRLGVKLKRGYVSGENKTVEVGYMYKYSTSFYKRRGGEVVTPLFLYATEINLGGDKCLIGSLGGEGRSVKVCVGEDSELRMYADRLSDPREVEEGYYVALTPVPVIPDSNVYTVSSHNPDAKGLEFVERIVGFPIVQGEGVSVPSKRIERLSLGYSIALKARRPMIFMLPPGTVLNCRKIKETKVNRLIKTLWSLGFASLLKLN